MRAESQPTPPHHGCPSLQTEVPQGRPSSSSPFLSGKAAPEPRRPLGVGPCPPEVLPGGGAPPGDEAHPGSSGSEHSDHQRWMKLRPEGAERRVRNLSQMLARLCPMEGGTTLLSTSRRGPHAAPAGLPCTPGSHGLRPAHLCLLSFPAARQPRASASPLLLCV